MIVVNESKGRQFQVFISYLFSTNKAKKGVSFLTEGIEDLSITLLVYTIGTSISSFSYKTKQLNTLLIVSIHNSTKVVTFFDVEVVANFRYLV